MTRFGDDIRVDAPGRVSPGFVRFSRRFVRPLVRLAHRASLEGVERLPRAGAYLLVANHSAGLGIAEILSFAALYLEQVGADRPLAGFTHPLSFRLFPASVALEHLGAIPSTYAAAEATLAAGVPILVFPGGDHETMRPIWQAHRVDLGGRKGFLRIARKAGVPIVPMGIRGSHFTAPVLWRSRVLLRYGLLLPWLLGLKRWALTLFGLLGALAILFGTHWSWPWRAGVAWAWLASPLIFFSWIPWTIRMRIGEPIAAAALFPDGDTGDDASLDAALARVQAELQRLVDP